MASAFLSSILSKTGQVLGFAQRSAGSPSSSSDPRSRVLKDLKELARSLKRIQAVLHDAEEREIRDESVKLWLKELKAVAYEADDVLDEYQYEVLRAQVEDRASRKRKRVDGGDGEGVSILDGMGDRIREIRERFDEISQHRESLHLREEDGELRVLEAPYPAPTSHMVDELSIYGREHDKQKVIDLLFSEGVGNGVSVIPIVGKGGLGKTTIAQLVYNDPEVKQHFDLTGWVCVSNDFDVPRLTKTIIESLTQSSCDLAQLSTLQDTLKEAVKGKRVLLVLDDVWNDQQSRWESLRSPFVGAETVRIIMTCRNDSVAEIMQTVHPYHPDCLFPEQSWSLFRHYAFGGRDPEEQPRLADMGQQIVDKCFGLPLAVKSIGSLLGCMEDEDSWMNVKQSDIWEVDENIMLVLRFSYRRMPAHLKPCFVYCSMFPKDYEFDKDKLVRLWMAQGYIQTSGGRRSLEDIGNAYFNDLQRRSFFDSYWSKFKMHDMIHDLAKSIAGNECWTIVDKELPSDPKEVLHLYVKDGEEFVKSLHSCNFSTLRTLLIPYSFRFPTAIQELIEFLLRLRCLRTLNFFLEREYEIPNFFRKLKHLRNLYIISNNIEKLPDSVCLLYHLQILELDCENLAELPDGLGNLTNLRYFKLFAHRIKRLPGTVCQLCNLHTLELDCLHLTELPDGLGNLTNLHHLQIANERILCLPVGIGKVTKLQSLLGCYKVQGGIGVLKDLVNLQGFLSISGLRNLVNIEDVRVAGLKHKHKFEKLFLHWNAVNCNNDPYHHELLHLEAFPEKNKDVPADEKWEEAMLEYLQPHANLKELLIDGYGGSKFPEWMGNPFSFASLQEICIFNCEKISSLPLYIHYSFGNLDAPISTSMLKRVYISGCRQLTSIAGLHHLHSLQDLKIENCPQLRLLSEEGLPSNVRYLHIHKCQQLTSLPRMQNLTFLGRLFIQNCPKLQIMAEDQLSYMPSTVKIVDCPGLANWCQIQNINCIQVASGNKLTISNTWENIMHGFGDLTSVEYLCFSNSWEFLRPTWKNIMPKFIEDLYFGDSWEPFLQRDSIPVLEELTIWGCTDIPPLRCLPKLTSLRSLVIKDCPGVQVLEDKLLPSTLDSLVVDSCEDLTFLRLAQQNREAFEELQLVNCPKLEWVEGLNCLFFPKILRVERCPQLRLPQDDWQPSISPHVEFAEETENKETIDDGTQKKQVSDCVKNEQANSAVSSIFDVADDCNMGHFLQLGFPSGCCSQSPVHNNAEPSMVVLDECTNLLQLSSGIGSLTSLRHLQISEGQITCLPGGIEKLTNLQSLLGCYKVRGGIGGVLKDLVNLRTLSISGLKNVVNIEDARDAGLKYKHNLEQLFLHWNAVDCINNRYHEEHRNGLLHLEVFPEENKDVPADEKREEAILEYLQPHANLKILSIQGYGGSKFPEWVGDPFSFASLQEISIIDCEKIISLPLYIHDSLENLDAPISTSMLERLYISGCRQLTSIAGLHHLHSLKDLKIENCPQLQLFSVPSNVPGT